MKKKTIPKVIKKQEFYILDCIFKQKVHILINYKNSDWIKWCAKRGAIQEEPKNGDGKFAGFSTFMSSEGKPNEYIILVSDFEWTLSQQNTLIHEITHTIIKIWTANNIPFNEHTQEFLAHSIGNMYEDIGKKLIK